MCCYIPLSSNPVSLCHCRGIFYRRDGGGCGVGTCGTGLCITIFSCKILQISTLLIHIVINFADQVIEFPCVLTMILLPFLLISDIKYSTLSLLVARDDRKCKACVRYENGISLSGSLSVCKPRMCSLYSYAYFTIN